MSGIAPAEEEAHAALRRALRDEAYALPVRLQPVTLLSRVAAEDRGARTWRFGLVGGLAAVLAVVALVALWPDRLRAPVLPGASMASAGASTDCAGSEAVRHGRWWVEVGGPNAFFNVEPGTRRATNPGERWLLIVRFDPAPATGEAFEVGAVRSGGNQLHVATFNSPMDPGNIYRFDDPAPDLPGAWYLFEQEVPGAGCWELVATVGESVVGRAVVLVGDAVPGESGDAPTPRIAPGESSNRPTR